MTLFDNTEIAFKSKSNKSLKRAYWLFWIMGKNRLVKFGKSAINLGFKLGLPINGLIKKSIFAQFCGGETIEECSSTIVNLKEFRIGTILDYSVEGKFSDEQFDDNVIEIINTIREASQNDAIPFAVFKVTGISNFSILERANSSSTVLSNEEKRAYDKILSRVNTICNAAFTYDVPLFFDAEETWIQDTIDRICLEMMRKYNKKRAIVYNTLQMYRSDRIAYLHEIINIARKEVFFYGIKLVRGAYMEKERERAEAKMYASPIQMDKAACDKDFNEALKIIVENLDVLSLCAGTHNEQSCLLLTELIASLDLEKGDQRIYFAQLLGMSDHISYNLANLGYNVAKYVPYGPVKEVMPYLLRRANENSSVAGQSGRELVLISTEKKRRGI
jgi:proline dehydrogenase